MKLYEDFNPVTIGLTTLGTYGIAALVSFEKDIHIASGIALAAALICTYFTAKKYQDKSWAVSGTIGPIIGAALAALTL